MSKVANGCGPAWMDKWEITARLKAFVAIYFLGWLFHASCNKHDEGYAEGGDWVRKLYCDLRFFAAMVKDVSRLDRWYKKVGALFVAYAYFWLVMLVGWFSFEYKQVEVVGK